MELKLNEKDLKFLWSTFCGKENEMEEHYFVDEDNLKMYMKLTDMYTDELIKWEEIINPETIIWVYLAFTYDYHPNHN